MAKPKNFNNLEAISGLGSLKAPKQTVEADKTESAEKKKVTVYLPNDVYEILEATSSLRGISNSKLIVSILQKEMQGSSYQRCLEVFRNFNKNIE